MIKHIKLIFLFTATAFFLSSCVSDGQNEVFKINLDKKDKEIATLKNDFKKLQSSHVRLSEDFTKFLDCYNKALKVPMGDFILSIDYAGAKKSEGAVLATALVEFQKNQNTVFLQCVTKK